MIKKIGLENFRVFKDYTEFELAPITVLTGSNNSGKSSFLKLLDLLKSNFSTIKNFDELNFESGNHNLGTFDKVLNWNNDNDEVKIILDLNLDYFDEKFKLEMLYGLSNEKGQIKSFKIYNENRILFLMTNFNLDIMNIDSEIDITYLKQTYNQNTICKEEKHYSLKTLEAFKIYNENILLKKPSKSKFKNQSIDFKLNNSKGVPINLNNLDCPLKIEEFAKLFFTKEYDKLVKRKYALFSPNKKGGMDKWDKTIVDNFLTMLSENYFKSISWSEMVSINNLANGGSYNFINNMFVKGNFNFEDYKYKFNSLFLKLCQKDGVIPKTQTEVLDFFLPKKEHVENFDKYFVKNIGRALKEIELSFESLNFISATRGNKNRVLANKSLNDIDKIVKDFRQTEIDETDISFIKNSLNLLNIKGEIEVERIEGVASVIYLIQENNRVVLSDLGYGYSQVIPILLKIILVNKRNNKIKFLNDQDSRNPTTGEVYDNYKKKELFYSTIIIEEPEANLHPNLQSKLADVLVLGYKTFGIHFILESHSEYLIRKLQYLSAKMEVTQDDILIYYLNSDEHVNEKELKVKKIKIDEFGALTDNFGPGFFDEATSLKFELMKLNQTQNN